MAQNDLTVKIGADDKELTQAMGRAKQGLEAVNKTAQSAGTIMSSLGSEVGRLSPAFGGVVNAANGAISSFMAFGPAGAVVAALSAGAGLVIGYFTSISEESKKRSKEVADSYLNSARMAAEALSALYAIGAGAEDTAIRKLEKEIEIRRRNLKADEDKLIKVGMALGGKTSGSQLEAAAGVKVADVSAERANIAQLEMALQAKKDTAFWGDYLKRVDEKIKGLLETQNKLIAAGAKGRQDATKAAQDQAKLLESLPDDTNNAMGLVFQQLVEMDDKRRSRDMAGWYNMQQLKHEAANRETASMLERIELERQGYIKIREERLRGEKAVADAVSDSTGAMVGTFTSTMADATLSAISTYGQFQGAVLAGDRERVALMKRDQDLFWISMAAGIAEKLSGEAIGQGTILMMRGAGEVALGNVPGGLAAIGIGGALVGLGVGGTFAGAIGSGYVSSTQQMRDAKARGGAGGGVTTSAPSISGPGTTGTTETTIINYYFGGPVFGNEDDAARVVSLMNDRGNRLRGARG